MACWPAILACQSGPLPLCVSASGAHLLLATQTLPRGPMARELSRVYSCLPSLSTPGSSAGGLLACTCDRLSSWTAACIFLTD